jgi:glycosyltransferase involved in cell wall biosynthesis
MKKILIISTHQSFCGIASYVEGIREGLATDFVVDVILLDQNILRSRVKASVEAGDRLIDQIIVRAKDYDVVNLHWRAELFGSRHRDQLRRLERLMVKLNRVVLTAHDPLPSSYRITPRTVVVTAFDHGAKGLANMVTDPNRSYSKRFVEIIKRAAATRDLTVVATNKRERRLFERVLELKHVYDHPPCFVRSSWKADLPAATAKRRDLIQRQVGRDAIILGVFGLIKDYKSIVTAIRALRYLPTNYHLCIFGGTDPMDIRERQQIDGTLKLLVDEANNKEAFTAYISPYARNAVRQNKAGSAALQMASADGVRLELPLPPDVCPPEDLTTRVHFVDTHGDFDFCAAIASSDICVFPYIEAARCYSGTALHAMEIGKPIITSNIRCFGEMSRYFPDRSITFDIGNYIQLAQRILALRQSAPTRAFVADGEQHDAQRYDYESQIALYRSIFTGQPAETLQKAGVEL